MAKLVLDLSAVDCCELRGHFLTCDQAAHHAGVSPAELRSEPGAVRIDGVVGREEVYPDWQFDPAGGFVHGLQDVVSQLRARLSGNALASYLTAPLPELGGSSLVDWVAANVAREEPIEVIG